MMEPLRVLVCAEDLEQCVVPLNQIAEGHVFGQDQPLHLLLHSEDRASTQDFVECLQECTHHLVKDISVAQDDIEDLNVAVVILINYQLQQHTNDTTSQHTLRHFITKIAEFISQPFNDTSPKVLVVGPEANLAASLLSQKLNCGGGNQMLAFQNTFTDRYGQYKSAHVMSTIIHKWWRGCQYKSSDMKVGIKVYGRRNTPFAQPTRLFIDVPVHIVGEKTFKLTPAASIDAENLHQQILEMEESLKRINKDGQSTEKKPKHVLTSSL